MILSIVGTRRSVFRARLIATRARLIHLYRRRYAIRYNGFLVANVTRRRQNVIAKQAALF
jgi:hypothetical protein